MSGRYALYSKKRALHAIGASMISLPTTSSMSLGMAAYMPERREWAYGQCPLQHRETQSMKTIYHWRGGWEALMFIMDININTSSPPPHIPITIITMILCTMIQCWGTLVWNIPELSYSDPSCPEELMEHLKGPGYEKRGPAASFVLNLSKRQSLLKDCRF